MAFISSLPPSNVPFVDQEGKVSRPWIMFLHSIAQALGGPTVVPGVTPIASTIPTSFPTFFDENIDNEMLIPGPIGAQGVQGNQGLPVYLTEENIDDGILIPGPLGPQGIQGNQGLPIYLAEENIDNISELGLPSSLILNTLNMSGAITPNTKAGIIGTIAADNANAGSVGEVLTVNNTISLTSGVTANVATLALTAGDWQITGCIAFLPAVGTTSQTPLAGLSNASLTFPATPFYTQFPLNFPASALIAFPLAGLRIDVSGAQNVYVVANINFAVSTMQAQAFIQAIRVR